jgi:plasmid maintenance system antidote protein VapI
MANDDRLPPIRPGEILREEFLSPLGISAHELALALRVPAAQCVLDTIGLMQPGQ